MRLIKTTVRIYLLYAIAVALVFSSFVGTGPNLVTIVLTYCLGFAATLLISMIPWIQKLVWRVQECIIDQLKSWKNKKQMLCQIAILIIADAIVAVLIERIMSYVKYSAWNMQFGFKKYIFALVLIGLGSLFLFYRKLFAQKVELIVFLIIIGTGTVYATTLPASCGVSWDDEIHYSIPLVMSHLFDRKISEADDMILEDFTETALNHANYTQEEQQSWYESIDTAYKQGDATDTARSLPRYKKLVYIPAAIGLLLGRALHLPYHMTFILGRWCNLLLYAIVIYLALKKLKSGKMIAAVIALLPPNIFMASSYSYDPWMTAFIMYGFCSFFGELQRPEKKIKKKDLIFMILAFFLGVGPKVIYIPLILVVLFLPKEKFQNQRQYRIFRGCVIGVALIVTVSFLEPFIVSNSGVIQDNRGGSDIDAAAQVAYIFANPFTYTKTLLKFLTDYISLTSAQSYLTYLHYFGTAGYSLVLVVLLFVTTFTDREYCDCKVKVLPRIITLGLSFATMCLVATSMYIAFTGVASDTILGCQYRYVIPFMFPVLYVIGSGHIENKMRREYYNGIILALCSFVLLNAVWTLCINIY